MGCSCARAVVALAATCLLQESTATSSDHVYSKAYAAKRSDYYLRRAAAFPWSTEECHALLEAALEIDAQNASVHARALGACGFQESLRLKGPTELQIGAVRSWPRKPREGKSKNSLDTRDLFGTPLGFLHASELQLKDWRATLRRFGEAAISKFQQVRQQKRRSFVDLNNHFFQSQDTDPLNAMAAPQGWPELYSSSEYKEWATVSRDICTSFINKLGVSLSEEEAKMELVTWAAVYPKSSEPVTHYYHAHQESIVSFVLYVKMPQPTTPLTISDPRGAPPVEDFEWFQDLGDLGVDGDPPFHRPMEFYAEEGDILIFPSFAIHKVPPHLGDSTRVVFPTNCHLPKKFKRLQEKFEGNESPLDGWERIARWQAPMLPRAGVIDSYAQHALAALKLAQGLEDPYMKLWEVQNQVLAMLQFGASDASAWLAAGNASAKAAVLLDSRGEGTYYLDSALMFAGALRLDKKIKAQLDTCLEQLIPKKVKKQQKDAYRSLSSWRKLILSWGTEPPELEVTQFLHEDVNGPGRCSRMCPGKQEPRFRSLRILPAFSTRIYSFSAAAGDPLKAMVKAAQLILEEELPGVQVTSQALPRGSTWREGPLNASLTAVVCGPKKVLLADPRGKWPKNWPGSLQVPTALEPKAPFHWHQEVPCAEGRIILLPAWLQYQAEESYALTAVLGDRPLARRWPRPELGVAPVSGGESEEL